jgi:hypothetical protein
VRKNILNRAQPKLQETTTTEARPKEAAEETLPLKTTSAEAKKVPTLPENPGLTIVLPSPPEDAVIVSAPDTSADSEADAVTADSQIAVEETKEEELEEELVEEEEGKETVIEDPELLPLITTLKVRFLVQICIQYLVIFLIHG